MNYVWRLSKDGGIVGNVRFVLLCIAKFIPKRQGCMETPPVSQALLSNMTGLDPKTVRHCVKELVSKKELTIGQPGRGRGNHQTFIMPNLAGPLFAVSASEKSGSPPAFSLQNKAGAPPHLPTEKRASCPPPVRTSSSSNVRTEERTTTTAKKPVAAEVYDNALTFLHWFVETYPEHNHGAQVSIDFDVDGPLAESLFRKPVRTLPQLQAMAIVMWTVTEAEDRWLAQATERGVRLLHHAADRYDRFARARGLHVAAPAEPWWWKTCTHAPKCGTPRECNEIKTGHREAVG